MIDRQSRQLALELPHRTAFGRDDFLVTTSNAAAVAMIDRYPDWPYPAMVLVGDAGSGKSHLLEVWRQASGARILQSNELGAFPPEQLLTAGALGIDDAPGIELDERALFHLINLARQTGSHILLASQGEPSGWKVALPDLASRLKALPATRIEAPDDTLLRGVLVKLFSDRQLAIDEQVISYLMMRMPRSLASARRLVNEIDRLALEEMSAVTRPLVSRVLQRFTEPDLFRDEE